MTNFQTFGVNISEILNKNFPEIDDLKKAIVKYAILSEAEYLLKKEVLKWKV